MYPVKLMTYVDAQRAAHETVVESLNNNKFQLFRIGTDYFDGEENHCKMTPEVDDQLRSDQTK